MTATLDQQVAVVTGGTQGIGRAIAEALSSAGAQVVVCSRDGEKAAAVAADIGAGTTGAALDVRDEEAVKAFFKDLAKDRGRIDILVNNAGITADMLLPLMKRPNWDNVIETNLTGAFLCSRAVVRTLMKQRSGCIINISSASGIMGAPGQANYSAAKAGLIGLTKSMAREFASRGVRVNCVAPGFVDTAMTAALPEAVGELIETQVPLGRMGTVEEVAAAVRFLASPDASYITGAVLQVDGGLAM